MKFEETLAKISKTLTKLDERNSDDAIKTILESTKGKNDKTLKTIEESITKIGTAAEMLANGEGIDIFSGILTILSSASLFIPGGGPVIGAVLCLASSFISAFCSSKGNVGCVVENSIMLALKKFKDSELKAKTVGTVHAYRISLEFLNGITQIKTDEVSAVMSSVPILYGVQFLGTLKYKIEDDIKSNDKDDILRAIEYTKAYTELSVLRSGVLLKLKFIISTASQNIADGIQSIMDAEKKVDSQFLENIFKREKSRAVFFAYLRPSTMDTVLKYLQNLDIAFKLSDLENNHSISFKIPAYSTTFGLTRPYFFSPRMCYNSRDENSVDVEYSFYLQSISQRDSIFYIVSKISPQLYVYMSDDSDNECYAQHETPGPEGQWKITEIKDRHYILSTIKWPEYFLTGRMYSTDDYKHKPKRDCAEDLMIKLKGLHLGPSYFDLRKYNDDDSDDDDE